MLIDEQLINEFTHHVNAANKYSPRNARLNAKSNNWQKESSMRPILNLLTDIKNGMVDSKEFENRFKPMLVNMKPEKQRKYATAIKFLQKKSTGSNSKMFERLHTAPPGGELLSVKLSKSQQRYTTPIIDGDAGHGVCLQMALLWLREQTSFHIYTQFPRQANKNVVASRRARSVTEKALAIRGRVEQVYGLVNNVITNTATYMGLEARKENWHNSFNNLHTRLNHYVEPVALLISFYQHQHTIALVRKPSGDFLFYDANVGSFRIMPGCLGKFLKRYNACLRAKWQGYDPEENNSIDSIYTVTRA